MDFDRIHTASPFGSPIFRSHSTARWSFVFVSQSQSSPRIPSHQSSSLKWDSLDCIISLHWARCRLIAQTGDSLPPRPIPDHTANRIPLFHRYGADVHAGGAAWPGDLWPFKNQPAFTFIWEANKDTTIHLIQCLTVTNWLWFIDNYGP